MQIFAREHGARHRPAKASAGETLPACPSPIVGPSDGDTISSCGSKGRNFRDALKTTQPPSARAGLRDRPSAPTARSQTLRTRAGGKAGAAQPGSTCPPHWGLLPGAALQHLSSCAHTHLWPHQLLNAALVFWDLHYEQQESRQTISTNGAAQTFVL